ncbi:MAG: LacI family transcriptional regulator [Silicimonas sp.]|nr:LacI family transcriptional regulator [Silicimonas sp.]
MGLDETRKRANLRDVAAKAGVSVATVSRVLNAPEKVAPETRHRVETAIAELKFFPSAAARAMNRGRSGTVAALLPTLDNAIYARVVNGLEARLAEEDLSLMVAQTGDDPEIERDRAQQMAELGAEALVVVGLTHDPELYDLIDRTQIPVVAISAHDPQHVLPTIGYDNAAAAHLAADYLAGLGHRRIAVLHGPVAQNDRMRFRKTALEERGDDLEFHYIETPLSTEGGYRGIARLPEGGVGISAALCFSDVIAHGALSGLLAAGRRVPGDMSVIGMENLPGSRFTAPALTSVRLSVEDMGNRAGAALVEWLQSGMRPASVALPVEIIERKSCDQATE